MRSPLWIVPVMLLVTVAGTVPPVASHAAQIDVQVANFAFTPRDIVINQGDSVRWFWTSGSHTVTNGTNPGEAGAGALFNASMTSASTEFIRVFNDPPGLIPYHCAPHWFVGMTGTITVNPSGPAAATHVVAVREFEFDPRVVTVEVGDTVRWVWENGSHTTTSGASSNQIHSPGALWNAPITQASPSFDFVVPDTAGLLPYFCVPHELAGMRGVIAVGSATGLPDDHGITGRFSELRAPFPNPTGGSSTIVFHLDRGAEVSLDVFDLRGAKVAHLAGGYTGEGYHVVHWNGYADHGHVTAPGIYFVRLRAGGESETRKIIRASHDADHAHAGHH